MAARKRKAAESNGAAPKKKRTRSTATTPPSDSMRITRGMTTDAPRKAVFATAELLENIMLFLPARMIFGVQRVCKQFRDTVTTSASIRQQMFLRLSGAAQQTWAVVPGSDPTSLNGGSLKRLDDPTNPPANAIRGVNNTVVSFVPIKANPLLTLETYGQRLVDRARWLTQESFALGIKETALFEHASWQNTYLTEQACTHLTVSFEWRIRGKGGISGNVFCEVDGCESLPLTIGEVVRHALEEEKSGEQHHFYWVTGEVGRGGMKHKGTLRSLLSEYAEKLGRPAVIMDGLRFYTRGVMVPSADERRQAETAG